MSRLCPKCGGVYGDAVERCPVDRTPLEAIEPEDDPYVGTVIDGRFRLDDLLGAGGMGRVYRGMQLSVDRPVAVKILRGEAVPDRRMKERFLREARVISGFRHPNIVRLIDFGNDPDRNFPYLVMELAGGVSLADLIGSGRLHPALAIDVARQVCSGLLEAHDAKIVHRDLKPDNLHLLGNSDGSFLVKILDFGIAFPREASTSLTATGMMCGTATYVSPEQARAREVDGQSDLYSLGVILFEMLSGVLPFRGESGFEIVMKHVQEPPPDLRQYLPPGALPEALVDLVYELLEKDPRDRPAGARRTRDRLDAIAEELDRDVGIDVGREGIQQFERWLLAAVPDEAPIHDSDTLGEGEAEDTPAAPDEGPSLSRAETDAADAPDAVTPADGTEQLFGEKPPPSSREARGSTDDSNDPTSASTRPNEGSLSRRHVVAVIGGLVLAAALGTTLLWVDRREGSGNAESARAEAPSRSPDATGPGTDAAQRLEPVTGPLHQYAGRCVLVGASDVDFHTLYFYPEVGELMIRGGETLWWSPLEVVGRRGERVEFAYRSPESGTEPDELDRRGSVRKSADKRLFELDSGTSFVCRRESYGAYYTDLALDGTWRSVEGGGTISVAEAGQRLDIEAAGAQGSVDAGGDEAISYRYRLLDGDPDEGTRTLAVRRTSGASDWSAWQLESRSDPRRLRLRRGTSEEAAASVYHPLEEESEPAATEGSKAGRRPSRPSRPETEREPRGEDVPPETGAARARAPSGDRGRPGSLNMKAWRARHERIVERCRSAYEAIESNNRRHQQLLDAGDYERARDFTETLRTRNEEASEKMQKAAEAFSSLVQEMATAGAPASKIQKMSAEFSAACQGK